MKDMKIKQHGDRKEKIKEKNRIHNKVNVIRREASKRKGEENSVVE